MDSLDSLNSVVGDVASFDTVSLIMLMIGIFFFGAITAAIQKGIKEQGWFGLKKPNRTSQTKKQMQYLQDIANNANDSE